MKTYTLILLFVFFLPISTFAQWYEPAPCYACVPQSGSQSNPYTDQAQRGWAPNYGLGYDNGTSFGGGAPQGEWQSQSGDSSDWLAPSQNYQAVTPQQPNGYSYGVPGTGKPLACGPYYNQRARPGC